MAPTAPRDPAAAVPHPATTSFVLGNLHCPSCVAFIQALLADTFHDAILSVSPSLVTSVVAVEHRDVHAFDLPVDMGKALEDAGFELCGVYTTSHASALTSRRDGGASHEHPPPHAQQQHHQSSYLPWTSWWWRSNPDLTHTRARDTHLEHCASCRHADEAAPHDTRSLAARDGADARPSHESKAQPQALESVVVGGDAAAPPQTARVLLSVGGMTCAVCSNGITADLEKRPWVTKVAVNLVGNSATVDVDAADRPAHDRAAALVEAIEDLGYDAAVDSVTELGAAPADVPDARELEIRVQGMFCARCPARVSHAVEALGLGLGELEILQHPTLERPWLRLRYTPEPPRFTVRHILRAIHAADAAFAASIYHPPTLEDRSRAVRAKHQRALAWRLLLTVALAIPTFVVGIVYMSLVPASDPTKHRLEAPWASGLSRMDVILCALATPVYLLSASLFHARALREVRTMWRPGSRTPLLQRFYKFGSMNMLISLGTTIAYLSSVLQMVVAAARGRKPPGDHLYFDSVVFLTLFLLAGRLIEAYSKSKTGDAVEKLGQLRPRTALLAADDGHGLREVPVDQLDCGDLIRVPSGASPPADGIIVAGDGSFDEASLTGESRHVRKGPGDRVFAGTVNKAAPVTVRVSGVDGRSLLDQIVDVVREGQTRRAPVEQIADVATTYFVPVITLLALLTFAVWLALALSGTVTPPGATGGSTASAVAFAFRFAIAVFVVACPCGLALAAPTAIFVGGGLAAKHGILAKGGGEAFEKGSKVDCVVFDKTGTLTLGGAPQVTDFYRQPGDGGSTRPVPDDSLLLSALKALEENSSHPIAKAIVAYCGEADGGGSSSSSSSITLQDVQEMAGMGLQGTCEAGSGHRFALAVGNENLLRSLDVALPAHTSDMLHSWKAAARSVALVAVKPDGRASWSLAAALSISDPVRPEAPAVIRQLRGAGISVWMLSGDNLTTARAVAAQVGISPDNVLAEVLPSEKASRVSTLQRTLPSTAARRGRGGGSARATVAMVGDGINDSPALTTADVGIAIGSGSDVAISSADFVLATSSLRSVPTLLALSRAVLRRVRLNFGWAVVYNLIAVPMAAGALYGVRTSSGGGHQQRVVLDPVWAALAMALSSISVVVSSLCLRTRLPLVGFRVSSAAGEGEDAGAARCEG